MQNDAGKCSIRLMLDPTLAFDMVDHQILLDRLKYWVGVCGSAFEWSSYFSERCFSVTVSKYRSSSTSLTYGVPQGSVLGPLLFLWCLLPLKHILKKTFGYTFNLSPEMLLNKCLDWIKAWMADNFLQLQGKKLNSLYVHLTDLVFLCEALYDFCPKGALWIKFYLFT